MEAFRLEVIERTPQEFKISCLNTISSLFRPSYPFYAGKE
jgi:phosphatidate phosphatase PAH1